MLVWTLRLFDYILFLAISLFSASRVGKTTTQKQLVQLKSGGKKKKGFLVSQVISESPEILVQYYINA